MLNKLYLVFYQHQFVISALFGVVLPPATFHLVQVLLSVDLIIWEFLQDHWETREMWVFARVFWTLLYKMTDKTKLRSSNQNTWIRFAHSCPRKHPVNSLLKFDMIRPRYSNPFLPARCDILSYQMKTSNGTVTRQRFLGSFSQQNAVWLFNVVTRNVQNLST